MLLDRTLTSDGWSLDDAEAWWGRHERAQTVASANSENAATGTVSAAVGGTVPGGRASGSNNSSTPSVVSGFDRTIAR
jgi:hypothetical protein